MEESGSLVWTNAQVRDWIGKNVSLNSVSFSLRLITNSDADVVWFSSNLTSPGGSYGIGGTTPLSSRE